jgi:hypothetical protein
MEQLVFLSLFLGLVSGKQPVDLRAAAAVKSIVILLGDREAARIAAPPWHAVVDFGAELAPRELVAVAYDERGNELTRVSQIINLPRPAAEVGLVLKSDANGTPARAELTWRHREGGKPKSTVVKVDGRNVPVSKQLVATLPDVNWSIPHVISAQMRFTDGTSAESELVTRAGFSDSIGAEMTTILLRATSNDAPKNLDACLAIGGEPLHTRAIDYAAPLVIVVKDPNTSELAPRPVPRGVVVAGVKLDKGTTARVIWPVGNKLTKPGELISELLDNGPEIDVSRRDFRLILGATHHDAPVASWMSRRFADAVAVAGLTALRSHRNRAVVLLLSDAADASRNDAGAVRRYLASIGVPLYVWSATGPHADLAAGWGAIEDVSTPERLANAVSRLRSDVAQQRVAWVAADPLRALRATATGRCAVQTVAQRP